MVAQHYRSINQDLAPRRGRGRLRVRAVSLVIGIAALLLVVGTARAIHRNRQVATELTQLQQRISNYQVKNGELVDTIRYLSSDEFVAVEARRSLGLGTAGEQPVVVRPPAPADGSDDVATAAATGPSLPQLWWRYFFGEST
jgi:cell division protein FtsB